MTEPIVGNSQAEMLEKLEPEYRPFVAGMMNAFSGSHYCAAFFVLLEDNGMVHNLALANPEYGADVIPLMVFLDHASPLLRKMMKAEFTAWLKSRRKELS